MYPFSVTAMKRRIYLSAVTGFFYEVSGGPVFRYELTARDGKRYVIQIEERVPERADNVVDIEAYRV